jgi:hypothetical protein
MFETTVPRCCSIPQLSGQLASTGYIAAIPPKRCGGRLPLSENAAMDRPFAVARAVSRVLFGSLQT